ncbi:phosphopantetheine-binding protein [Pseudomonas sp. ZT5P21]
MAAALSAKLKVKFRVIGILSFHLPPSLQKIDNDSRLVNDLYVDSMSLIEIVMDLNQAFGIQLPEAGVREWRTVADICSLVRCSRG